MLGEKIKAYRESKKMTQKDIAEILQISEWQVYEEMKKADVEYILVDYSYFL